MLVQHRPDGSLRLIRQHDHALASGELAAGWVGVEREPAPLSFELILSTALHDVAWRRLDDPPRLDPDTSLPLAFHDFPVPEKVRAYREGLDRVGEIHPYAGLLGSLHYASFPDVAGEEGFQSHERERRRRLRRELALGPEDEGHVERDLAFLRLFDALSIFLCLTPRSADPEVHPSWVEGGRHAETPDGHTIHLTWMDDSVVHVDPFPFRDTLELRLPYRRLRGTFESQAELETAWEGASDAVWWIEVREPLRLA